MTKQLFCFILLILPLLTKAEVKNAEGENETIPKVVHLNTTEWCPYACPNGPQRGIAYDYLTHVFKRLEIDLEIRFLPWSRAIKQVGNGQSHGLLTAVHSEAPNLLFTTTPTMTYQVCFFRHAERKWAYKTTSSLNGVRLGVIDAYGYGEPLDSYITDHTGDIVKLTGEHGLRRLLDMTFKRRIDVFVDDANTIKWELKRVSRTDREKIVKSGCLSHNPFFLALSPKLPWAKTLTELLNSELKKADNVRFLDTVVLPNYQ